ncbi:MAG: metal ABC transporter ATP-binding protein [Alphaproteobacteria bacterium]|nr:metal ABC transporter ATP-binding protein [Alphaproteobacteria bacterium]
MQQVAVPGAAVRAEAPAADALLSVRGATVSRGGERILTAVDLTAGRNETVTLLGPNGAGKTTLLRIAMGLMRPDEGTVLRRDGLRIGYVPQHFPVASTMPLTVDRLLTLSGRVPEDERRARLAEVGAAVLQARAVSALSGGELRRVLLARALLREPDLLVLDEPVQGVDMAGQAELYALIARAARARGAGVLMVSHDLHLVMATTDRVVCLNRHVCCEGAPEAVGKNPEYLALFGGLPDGVAVYTHHHDHAHDVSGGVVPVADMHHGHRH